MNLGRCSGWVELELRVWLKKILKKVKRDASVSNFQDIGDSSEQLESQPQKSGLEPPSGFLHEQVQNRIDLVQSSFSLAQQEASPEKTELYLQNLASLDRQAVYFEEQGQWQASRSFYMALARIGHLTESYESVACGLSGAIRISKKMGYSEQRLLGYYDDLILFSLRFQEYAAAAELCSEAAVIAGAEARNYWSQAGNHWFKNGDFLFIHLDCSRLAEASFQTAAECYLRASEQKSLSLCYQRLAALADSRQRNEFLQLAYKLGLESAWSNYERRESLTRTQEVFYDEEQKQRYLQLYSKIPLAQLGEP